MLFRSGVGLRLALSLWFSMALGAEWLDVPFVRQEKNGCGAASISMVMRYWSRSGAAADPATIQSALYSAEARGIHGRDVEGYFREHGFTTFLFKGAWSDVEQHLAKGRPLLVCLQESRAG